MARVEGIPLPALQHGVPWDWKSTADYLDRVEALRVRDIPIGVAPHSVRAVPEDWFRAIAGYNQIHHLPLHVHADEQIVEIEQCQAVYGCTPIELLERFGALGTLTTIVHATHANATEIALLAQYGCVVCVCPTTEGDLGDGPLRQSPRSAVQLR